MAEEHERSRGWRESRPDIGQRRTGIDRPGPVGRAAGENTIPSILRKQDSGPGTRVELDRLGHQPFGEVCVAVKGDDNRLAWPQATGQVPVERLPIIGSVGDTADSLSNHLGWPITRGLKDQPFLIPPDEKNEGHADREDGDGNPKGGDERNRGHNGRARVPEFR